MAVVKRSVVVAVAAGDDDGNWHTVQHSVHKGGRIGIYEDLQVYSGDADQELDQDAAQEPGQDAEPDSNCPDEAVGVLKAALDLTSHNTSAGHAAADAHLHSTREQRQQQKTVDPELQPWDSENREA